MRMRRIPLYPPPLPLTACTCGAAAARPSPSWKCRRTAGSGDDDDDARLPARDTQTSCRRRSDGAGDAVPHRSWAVRWRLCSTAAIRFGRSPPRCSAAGPDGGAAGAAAAGWHRS